MRITLITAAIVSTLSISAAAMAEPGASATSAIQLKAGDMVRYSDGRPVGRIEYVGRAKDGAPTDVAVAYENSRMVHIPVSTLSAGQKDYVTSLTKDQVSKLN